VTAPTQHNASSPSRPPLAVSALGTYGTNLAVAVLSFTNVLVVARSLGPTGRGDVAFLTTIAFLSAALATFGVHQANVNFAGRRPTLRPSLATNSLLLALILGGLAIATVAGLVALFPGVGGGVDPVLRWLALASIPAIVLNMYLQELVIADYGFKVANSAWLLPSVLNVTVNGLLAVLGVISTASAVSTWIAGQAIAAALLVWYVQRRSAGFGRPDEALARRMFVFGAKTHGGRIMMYGNFRLDQWIVGSLSGARELGLYSVAVAWAEALFFLPTSLVRAQRPDLVRASPREAARRAATAFRAALLVTALLAIGLFALAPLLTAWVFGNEFRGSIDDLRVLTLGGFGVVALKLLGNVLTAQRKPLLETTAISVAFVATLALDIVLIPPFGGFGAALASSIAYTAGGVVVVLLFVTTFGRPSGGLIPRARDVVWFRGKLRELLRRPLQPAPEDAALVRTPAEGGP
jgi:O-antigen/teichoic acid export membrane protein